MTETYDRKAKYKFAKEYIGYIFGGDFTYRSRVHGSANGDWTTFQKKLVEILYKFVKATKSIYNDNFGSFSRKLVKFLQIIQRLPND